MRRAVCLLVVAVVAAGCTDDDPRTEVATTSTTTTSTTTTTTAAPEPLRVNDLVVLGSHNSYHLRPMPAVYAGIEALSRDLAESIDYSHRSLTDQLETFGVRQFELDVFADPDGGLYANRAALPVIGLPVESGLAELDEPGFKVLHTQDFDFETNCLTLQICLGEIRTWSDANPDHLPLMIMIELKEESVPDAAARTGVELPDLPIDWAIPVETTEAVMDALDTELRLAMGIERILTPDDVRAGAATLEEVVLADGWPTVEEARGKVMFGLVNTGSARDVYRERSAVLEGRAMFTTSSPGDPDAAFLRIDDPVEGGAEIGRLAAAGYLIRTRTDTPTADARNGDTSRRDAALDSGAHFLSTDYYVEDESFGTGYEVVVTDRCNPVTAPPDCVSPKL